MINISISTEFRNLIKAKKVREIADLTFANVENFGEPYLSIVFKDDKFIKDLNFKYRGYNEATDVLSFPSDEIDPLSGIPYLGDVIISVPTLISQAEENNRPVFDEMSLLIIHGILHLLGYDHDTTASKSKMWEIQENILDLIGSKIAK